MTSRIVEFFLYLSDYYTYYKRKLAMHNLTVFELGRNVGTCYTWTEHEHLRGANDIEEQIIRHCSITFDNNYTSYRIVSLTAPVLPFSQGKKSGHIAEGVAGELTT